MNLPDLPTLLFFFLPSLPPFLFFLSFLPPSFSFLLSFSSDDTPLYSVNIQDFFPLKPLHNLLVLKELLVTKRPSLNRPDL